MKQQSSAFAIITSNRILLSRNATLRSINVGVSSAPLSLSRLKTSLSLNGLNWKMQGCKDFGTFYSLE